MESGNERIVIDAFKALLIRQVGPLREKPLAELTAWYCALSEIVDEIYQESIIAVVDESNRVNRKALHSLAKSLKSEK